MTVEQPKRLRILLSAYACEPNRGSEPGIGWNWAIALAQRGHHVWVLTRANNRTAIETACGALANELHANINFLYYDLPRWAAWWKKGGRGVQLYYALWQRNILSLAQAAHAIQHFDVVHHLTFGVWRQPTQLYKLGVPLIFGPVGGGETAPPNLVSTLPFKARIWESIRNLANWLAVFNPGLRNCLCSARWVVSKTRETAAWVEKAGGRSTVAFEIGINSMGITPKSESSTSSRLRCLFAGRLIGWKGIHLAIAAIAAARSSGSDVTLTIVGRGPQRESLGKQVHQEGLDGHVTFIDWLDQQSLFEQYRHHDVLLFPSLHDSSGNVILEAFAHGLPAVCLNLGGPGELVNQTNGISVEPNGDPVLGLSNALQKLCADYELRRSLSDGAKAHAQGLSWIGVVSELYHVPETVLSTKFNAVG